MTSVYKKPSLAALQAECDAFNFDCKVGGRVAVKIDGTDTPLITTTRSPAQILSGHSAVVWMDGVSGCYLLSHVTPIPELTSPTVFERSYHSAIERLVIATQFIPTHRLEEYERAWGTRRAILREQAELDVWTTTPPTEQGEYWHWSGDADSAPTVLDLLYSGTAKKCFVPMNQSYTGQAIMCDVYGGHWKRLRAPALPIPA